MGYTRLDEEQAAELGRKVEHIKEELFAPLRLGLDTDIHAGRPCELEKAHKALGLMQTHLDRLKKQALAFHEAFGVDYTEKELMNEQKDR